jgi:hypothetical protein
MCVLAGLFSGNPAPSGEAVSFSTEYAGSALCKTQTLSQSGHSSVQSVRFLFAKPANSTRVMNLGSH